MSLKPETKLIQTTLAEYCRSGRFPETIPGVKEDRLHHYRRLVFNSVNDTLQKAYPIAYKFLGDELWESTVDTFFKEHVCESPQFWKLPLEFYRYLLNHPTACISSYPFLTELLYFEWIEIEVHTMPDEEMPSVLKDGDWNKDVPVLNPEHRFVHLTYPVHLYKPEEVERFKGQYFLLVYRNGIGEVQFLNMSPLHTFVLDAINRGALVPDIAEEAASLFRVNLDSLCAHIISFLEDMKDQGVVLGFKAS